MYDLLADYVAREYALHRDFEWSAFQSTSSGIEHRCHIVESVNSVGRDGLYCM
jgi:hypothetical protein